MLLARNHLVALTEVSTLQRWAFGIATLVVALWYTTSLLDRGWIPHDEGQLGHTAERIVNGELLHRDFVEPYTGGLSYLHAISFQLLGTREETVLALLRELNQDQSDQRLLDIGCGDGLMFDDLAEFGNVEGVEIDATIVSPTNPWRDAIHITPFDETFQPGKTYGTILMLDVLEHLPDPAAALRHAMSLLEPRGNLIITVPAFRCLWTTHDDLNHHYTRYTRHSFRQLASGVAWIQQDRYLFHWLFLAKLLVRVRESFFKTNPQPPRLPPGWLNGLLYHVTRCELQWMRGLHLPFGGSYLAVVKPAFHATQDTTTVLPDVAIPATSIQTSRGANCL
jgi:2-polyprenyl-3-methyl-5-hydroxy-6-metoxy-1,4-benzoquinol methylase